MNQKQQVLPIDESPDPVYRCRVCHRVILTLWLSERYTYMVHNNKIVCSVENADLTAETGAIWLL
jgi:hypothetical protein